MSKRSGSTVKALLLGWLYVTFCCAMADPPDRAALEDRSLTLEAGGSYRFERGLLSVPENRQVQRSRRFDLEFHRLPKSGHDGTNVPAIFILKGGPGYDSLEEDLAKPGYYEYFFERFTALADVVIVGQRGFGGNNALPCPPLRAATLADVDRAEERHARLREGMARCRALHEGNGADLSGYTIMEMAQDVVEIAAALGYEEIQLVGNSFGSHWGMAVIRSAPDLISRATFSALEGPDHTFDNPLELESSLRRIARAAQEDPALTSAIGDRDLLGEFGAMIKRADEEPIEVSFDLDDEGTRATVLLDGDALRQLSRGFSRGTTWRFHMPIWPSDMLTMLDGDLEAGARRVARWWLNDDMDVAAYYSVECASGASAERRKRLEADARTSLMSLHELVAGDLCAGWPADLGQAFRAGFVADVPALLIQGDWDTSLPMANVPVVREILPNHHVITVHGGSHGALREAEEAFPEFRAAILDWIDSGSTDRLPESVTLPPIEWILPEAPATR
ncbi:MAG: alpha/beta fold hydrolase [Pseudomonadota bacterium]